MIKNNFTEKSTRRQLLALTSALSFAGLFSAIPSVAQAQVDNWPNKTIRIVVPYSAGGGTDIIARRLAPGLGPLLKQTVIVENKPGAGGNIGADQVAKSKPDGYTLLLAQDSLAIVPWLYKGLTFDPIKDFEPIGVGVFMPMALVVKNGLPVDSVKQLIQLAKANPNKLSYGTP